ncbi:MAG: transglutaminase domain-containing protein [Desulfomonile tiedjei]|nr:transglutaminase domain-containing protein [Desulfomonile tiedjei]
MILSSSRSRAYFRPLVTLIVVVLWVALIAILCKDRYIPTQTDLADALHINQVESDDWFLIRIRGAYAGYGRSRQYATSDGWMVRDDLNIALNLQGQVKPVRIVNESTVDDQYRLVSFRLRVSSGVSIFDQRGRMAGRNLVLEIPKSQGGGTRTIKLFEAPRMSRSLGLPLPLTGLEVGNDFRIPIFDPLDGHRWEAEIKVLEKANLDIGGAKKEAWRVRATFRTVEVIMWVDQEGKLLKGLMPLGITVIRSDKDDVAREIRGAGELPDLAFSAAVPVEGFIPDGGTLKSLRLKVESKSALDIPSDDYRQKLEQGEILLRREELPQSTYSLPSTDTAMQQYLQASTFISSGSVKVIETARMIVGDEKDPVKAARLITEWVYKNIKKMPTPSVPDAYTVLTNKQGDCNDHAVLAAALARAVGLPAQVVVGLVYFDGSFYYHAWVTYWAGKRWFTADPLMNLLPVDPTHVALLYGDVDKHLNVLSFLGQLKFKVVDAKL